MVDGGELVEMQLVFGRLPATIAHVTNGTVKLPLQLTEQIQAEAKRLGIDLSAYVRQVLEDHLRRRKPGHPPSLYELSSDLCGSVRSGKRDLSSNPKHLAGYGKWKQ